LTFCVTEGHLRDVLDERLPVLFDDFAAEVVEDVADERDHALQQKEEALRAGGYLVRLERLVAGPALVELRLDVAETEEVAEDQLVVDEVLRREDQVQRPLDAVLEREVVEGLGLLHVLEACLGRRVGHEHVVELDDLLLFLGVAPEGVHDALVRVQRQVARDVIREVVSVCAGGPHAQVEETLQLLLRSESEVFVQLGLCGFHEVHEEVSALEEEVLLDRAQPLDELLLVDDDADELFVRPVEGFVDAGREVPCNTNVLLLQVELVVLDQVVRQRTLPRLVVLFDHVEVLACREDLLADGLQEDRQLLGPSLPCSC